MDFRPNPRVDRIFAQWARPNSPGMSIAVSQAGKTVYARGYGLADLEQGIPNKPGTVFHAASLSKQFTAMAIMLLVERGKLSLDDKISRYIPRLPDVLAKITIGQMLHHISGIRDQWALATMAGWRLSPDVITRDDVMDIFVARMKSLNFKPGADFSYSNTNYLLAAEIVQKVSGRSLPEFSDRHIFKPLKMTHTTIIQSHGQVVRDRACGYQGVGAKFQIMLPNYDLTGPTNVQTTVEDLLRWNRNFDLKTVGGKLALAAMQTTAKNSGTYGLGLYVETANGMPIVEHDGRDAGYRSHFIRFPEQKLAIALLSNLALPDEHSTWLLVRKVAKVYLGKRVPPPAEADPPADPRSAKKAPLDDYVGCYSSKEIDSSYVIERTGTSSLALTRWKYPPAELTAAGEDVFHVADFSVVLEEVKLTFLRNRRGKVKGLRMDDISGGNRLANFRFKKAP
jgi:CubicO group peptidase (beta-lactamase class C family)